MSQEKKAERALKITLFLFAFLLLYIASRVKIEEEEPFEEREHCKESLVHVVIAPKKDVDLRRDAVNGHDHQRTEHSPH